MNDSFRTDVFVQYDPETIACACIHLAARQLKVPLPDSPPWYIVFNQEEHHIDEICLTILRLYARTKPNIEILDAKVNEIKIRLNESKKKLKGSSSAGATPNSSSMPNSPKNISPSSLTVPTLKRLKDGDGSDNSSSGRNNHVSKKKKRHHSRSRSRSFSSRSKSHSLSPSPRHGSKYRKSKKDVRDVYVKDRSRKRRVSRSLSPHIRSYSRSPDYKSHKKYYKEKEQHRQRSPYYRDDKYDSKYYDKSKLKKHSSNGHRRSRSPERYRR